MQFGFRKGFTIVELLVGLAILTTTVLAASSAFSFFNRWSRRNTFFRLLPTVSNHSLVAVSKLDNWLPYLKDLRKSTPIIPAQFDLSDDFGKVIFRHPQNRLQKLNTALDPCMGDCVVQVEFEVRNISGALKYAYRMAPLESDGSMKGEIASFGVPGTGPFQSADFTEELPPFVSAPLPPYCDPSLALFARGIDFSTGQMLCVTKATTPCAPGTLPNGYNVVGGSLQFTCMNVSSLTCANGFLLSQISFPSATSTKLNAQGMCMFDGPPTMAPIAGVCPAPYTLVAGTCVAPAPQPAGAS